MTHRCTGEVCLRQGRWAGPRNRCGCSVDSAAGKQQVHSCREYEEADGSTQPSTPLGGVKCVASVRIRVDSTGRRPQVQSGREFHECDGDARPPPLGVPHVWHVCTQTCGIDLKSAIACWASTLGVCFARCEVSGSSSVASLIKVRLAVGASWRKSPRWITMGMQPRRGGAARRKTRTRCGCYCDDSQPDSPACCTSKVRRC